MIGFKFRHKIKTKVVGLVDIFLMAPVLFNFDRRFRREGQNSAADKLSLICVVLCLAVFNIVGEGFFRKP